MLELNKTHNINKIKQLHIVECNGCYLDTNLSGEFIAMKSLKKINTKLHFLYRENEFLNLNYTDCCVAMSF